MSNTITNNNRFNTEAAAWDLNPEVHVASSRALQAIIDHNPQLKADGKDLEVLEIGCGTGLLSFMIAPYIRSLTAVDSAQGMIDGFNIKLAQRPDFKNILPVCALLESPDDEIIRLDPLNRGADKDLPHVASTSSLATLSRTTFPHSKISSTLYFGPEARRFHPEAKMQGVERHGILRKEVNLMLKDAGFLDVKIETAFQMQKYVEESPGAGVVRGEGGMTMTFPFLICMGKKG